MFILKLYGKDKLVKATFFQCDDEKCVIEYEDRCGPIIDVLSYKLDNAETTFDRVCCDIDGNPNGKCKKDGLIMFSVEKARKDLEDAKLKMDCINGTRSAIYTKGTREYQYYTEELKKH